MKCANFEIIIISGEGEQLNFSLYVQSFSYIMSHLHDENLIY